jgi:hypothetical protein
MNPPSSLSLFIKHRFYGVQYVDCDDRRRQKSLRPKKRTTRVRLIAQMDRLLKEKRKAIRFSANSSLELSERCLC